jgi:hypothetical protein
MYLLAYVDEQVASWHMFVCPRGIFNGGQDFDSRCFVRGARLAEFLLLRCRLLALFTQAAKVRLDFYFVLRQEFVRVGLQHLLAGLRW